MTVFNDPRKIKVVSLPSIPDSKIELYSTILTGDAEEIFKAENDFERAILMLKALIKDWDLTDEQKNKLSVAETLKRFSIDDLTWLIEQTDIGQSAKKLGRKVVGK